jgi:GAF domain
LKPAIAFACQRLSLAVVALGTVVMVIVFVVIESNSTRLGFFPILFQHNDNVVQVKAGSSPMLLHTGDRIDLNALTPQQRFALAAGARAKTALPLQVTRRGRTFNAVVTASPPDFSPRAALARYVGIPLCFFLSLGLAGALFLVRPRPITLAFYLYTILMLVKVNESPLDLAAWPMSLASHLAIQFVYPAAQLMILIFAQRLYGGAGRAWKWFLSAATGLSVLVLFAWVDPIVWMVFQRFGFPGPVLLFESVLDASLLVVVLTGLAYIASGATTIARGRVYWVIGGIALAPLLDLTWALANILSTLIGNTSIPLLTLMQWTDALLPWFGLAGSIFVVYGFLSQRVLDFRFAIGRAAIYAAVTGVILLIFGIIEWWVQQVFEDTKPTIFVSLFAALFIGFSLNALHGRIEMLLNTVFFREQRRAEEALRHAARALANTSSEKTLVEFLVDEPARVLGLTEDALFLARGDDGAFVRAADRGWRRREAERIDREDPLIVELRAEQASIVLGDRPRAETILPAGDRAPSLVVPLLMRGTLFGFVFYGGRSDGTPFTADERELLESIASSAAAAYDHIDANRSRERIAELEERLRMLAPQELTGERHA